MVSTIRTNKIYLDSNTLKIGNTREQLFHAWRSFNFDENTETKDVYVSHIRHVAALLGYEEPHFFKYLRIHTPQNYIGYCFP